MNQANRWLWLLLAHLLLALAGSGVRARALPAAQLLPPTNLAGAALGETSIQWSWQDTVGETHYELHDEDHRVIIGAIPADATSVVETGLQPGTTVHRHVAALFGSESAESEHATATTQGGGGPGQTVTDCKASVTIKLLKRTVDAAGTVDYEFEVKTSMEQKCLNGILNVDAKIVGDPNKDQAAQPGGVTVARPDPGTTKFPVNEPVTQAEQTFPMTALFKIADIQAGMKNIRAGTERFVVLADLRAGTCGCKAVASLVIPQAGVTTAPPGETTSEQNPPFNCNPQINPFYEFTNRKGADVGVSATYKVNLDLPCVPGRVFTTFFAFVVIDGVDTDITSKIAAKAFQNTPIPAPAFVLRHEFQSKERDFDDAIKKAAPGRTAEQLQAIRASLFFVVNTELEDACACVRSLSKTVKGSSTPGPTVACRTTAQITEVSRLLTDANYQVRVKARITVPRDCATQIAPGAFGILDVVFTVRITGTVNLPNGGVSSFTLLTIPSPKVTAEGPGGTDPIIATAQHTFLIPKAAINNAIAPVPNFTGNASLKTTASVLAKDLCGCSAGDAKTYGSPDIRTGVSDPLEFTPITTFLPCEVGLGANVFMSSTGDTVFVEGSSITTMKQECVPGRLTVTLDLTVVGTVGEEVVRRPLTKLQYAPGEVTINSTQAAVPLSASWSVKKVKDEIKSQFSLNRQADIDAVFATLKASYSGELSDDCGCVLIKSFEVSP